MTTSPVTQVALVDVNRAVRKSVGVPLRLAAGVIGSSVPIRMIQEKSQCDHLHL
ncbi:MAG: hypothetical protein ACLUD0_20770 [Eubacterium ramulus]